VDFDQLPVEAAQDYIEQITQQIGEKKRENLDDDLEVKCRRSRRISASHIYTK